jgi:hypothetical protein
MLAPVALACVAGGVGWAKLFTLTARFGRNAAYAGAALALVLAAVLLIAPARQLKPDYQSTVDEAHLNAALSRAIDAVGGPARVRACGSTTTGPFQVTPLAWRLDVHIQDIDVVPALPGSVFRAGPPPHTIPGAPAVAVGDTRFKPVATVDPWQVLQACAGGIS